MAHSSRGIEEITVRTKWSEVKKSQKQEQGPDRPHCSICKQEIEHQAKSGNQTSKPSSSKAPLAKCSIIFQNSVTGWRNMCLNTQGYEEYFVIKTQLHRLLFLNYLFIHLFTYLFIYLSIYFFFVGKMTFYF